jgi:hypothetical protein
MNAEAGLLFLIRPVGVFDEALNLVNLVVSYEYASTGFDSMLYLARGSRGFDRSGFRVTSSLMAQRENGLGLMVGGIAVEQRLFQDGRLTLEVPVSAEQDVTRSTAAFQLDVEQPLVTRETRLRLHASRTPADFFNPYGEVAVAGQQRFGGAIDLRIFGPVRGSLSADREENRTSRIDNARTTVTGRVSSALGPVRLGAALDGSRCWGTWCSSVPSLPS